MQGDDCRVECAPELTGDYSPGSGRLCLRWPELRSLAEQHIALCDAYYLTAEECHCLWMSEHTALWAWEYEVACAGGRPRAADLAVDRIVRSCLAAR